MPGTLTAMILVTVLTNQIQNLLWKPGLLRLPTTVEIQSVSCQIQSFVEYFSESKIENTTGHWLHVEGDNTPAYDSNGFVTGPDRTGTMINEMRSFLDFAQSKNILVIFVLWNGAVLRNQNTINLFWDEPKLQSYIDNALKVSVVLELI